MDKSNGNESEEKPETQEVSGIKNLRLPTFNRTNPEAWFAMIELAFYIQRITSDNSKYHITITALETEAIEQALDIVHCPQEAEKYEALKCRLLKCFSDSKETQLHKLLTKMRLDDAKPSQLLRKMRTLASKTPEKILQTLCSENLDLNQQAEIADKIVETTSRGQVMAVVPETRGKERDRQDDKSIEGLSSQMAALTVLIQQLITKVQSVEKKHGYGRGREDNRINGEQPRARSRTSARKTLLCS
ncbi:uncharacterized protein LOC143180349 [Calliopsis andreniformis]|uniref:uncharacterized protein LOC143180349 n=1 Tax=Calliopsis andreniformis TaxID=337506 RepID=UPI003FCD38FD